MNRLRTPAGWFLAGLLLLGLAACQAARPTPTAAPPTPAGGTPLAVVAATQTLLPTRPDTATPLSSHTPTSRPSPTATPTVVPSVTPTASATARQFATLDASLPTPATAIPTPVPPFAKPPEVTNILLLGNDVAWPQGGRTDSLIVVSINSQTKTASMLSLPRDLYVYIPGWKMDRINLALPHGHGSGYPGGGGALVKDTILYNFGIPIDYYARVGFEGFKQIVDTLGGVEIAVSCQLRDWRLISPELDPNVEENWEQFTLEPGVYEMDGDLALWYARSRRTSNDFERGRRQQQVLRAIFNNGLDRELLPRIPQLWDTYRETVETDLTLPVILQLAALAPDVRENGIQNLYLSYGAVRPWREPSTGSAMQLLQWAEAAPVLGQLMQPPVLNRAGREPIVVAVVSEGNNIMWRLAADNLAWHGFVPVRASGDGTTPNHTQVTYYGDNFKGSFDWLLAWVMDVDRAEIGLAPAGTGDPPSNYRVVLGYDYDPCRPELEAPRSGD